MCAVVHNDSIPTDTLRTLRCGQAIVTASSPKPQSTAIAQHAAAPSTSSATAISNAVRNTVSISGKEISSSVSRRLSAPYSSCMHVSEEIGAVRVAT